MAEICNAAQGNGGSAPRQTGERGRMQKSECTPRDTRRWNGSTRYLITYFAKLRQRRRRRSNPSRPTSNPLANPFLLPPPHQGMPLFSIVRCLFLWIFQRAALESWQRCRAGSGLFIFETRRPSSSSDILELATGWPRFFYEFSI